MILQQLGCPLTRGACKVSEVFTMPLYLVLVHCFTSVCLSPNRRILPKEGIMENGSFMRSKSFSWPYISFRKHTKQSQVWSLYKPSSSWCYWSTFVQLYIYHACMDINELCAIHYLPQSHRLNSRCWQIKPLLGTVAPRPGGKPRHINQTYLASRVPTIGYHRYCVWLYVVCKK